MYLVRSTLDLLFPNPAELRAFFSMSAQELENLSIRTRATHNATHSLFSYQHPLIRASVRALKYKNDTRVATTYAPLLTKYVLHTSVQRNVSYQLIPIPMSDRRRLKYGFNQCETICVAMHKQHTGQFTYMPHILKREHTTVSQTRLNRRERFANTRQHFTATQSLVDVHVMLIDDVRTTGATLDAAMCACIQAGAASVQALTIAHQPRTKKLGSHSDFMLQ